MAFFEEKRNVETSSSFFKNFLEFFFNIISQSFIVKLQEKIKKRGLQSNVKIAFFKEDFE